jgi:Ca2+-binding RTX toxin-like protein
VEYDFEARVTAVQFSAGAGEDSATLFGSVDNETLTIRPTTATLELDGMVVSVVDAERVVAAGGGGHDMAYFHGTADAEVYTGTQNYGRLTNQGFFAKASQFAECYVDLKQGDDIARLYDSPGDDTLTGNPHQATLSCPSVDVLHQVEGFRELHAFAIEDGNDTAQLSDDPTEESYVVTFHALSGTEAKLFDGDRHGSPEEVNQIFLLRTSSFDSVTATAGPGDTALLYGTSGDERYTGTATQGSLTVPSGSTFTAVSFEQIHSVAKGGRNNTAELLGTPEKERFRGTRVYGRLAGSGWMHRLVRYNEVNAYGGGPDVAEMFDTRFTDTFFGWPDECTYKAGQCRYHLRDFPVIRVRGDAAGPDTVHLYPGPNDTVNEGNDDWLMRGEGYSITVEKLFGAVEIHDNSTSGSQSAMAGPDEFSLQAVSDYDLTILAHSLADEGGSKAVRSTGALTPPDNSPPHAASDAATVVQAETAIINGLANDLVTTGGGVPLVIDILDNDTDLDSHVVAGTVAIVDPPNQGAALVNDDGTITYTPGQSFIGQDVFTYTVHNDGGAVFNVATVSVLANYSPRTDSATISARDAELMAMELSGEVLPPADLYRQIFEDLEAIRQAHPAMTAITHRPRWVPGELVIGLTDEGMKQYRNGQHQGLNSLNDQYGIAEIEERSGPSLRLRFQQAYNPEYLASLYEAVEGVGYAEPSWPIGDGDDIKVSASGYTFSRGWGDCLCGCIYRHYWDFSINGGSVVLSREGGDPLAMPATVPVTYGRGVLLDDGILSIDGTNKPDHVEISKSDGLLMIDMNGSVAQFVRADVEQIPFKGYGGDDFFRNDTDIRSSIRGGSGDDTLVGGSSDDYIDGGAGNDVIYGQDGYDVLKGGDGRDRLDAGAGIDVLYGQDGYDVLKGGGGRDRLDGGAGSDRLYGNGGNDWIFGGLGSDVLFGHRGDDYLVGGDGNDRLFGRGGDDSLNGGSGDDYLNGNHGNDRLDGGDGDDTIRAGRGNDVASGGGGNDRLNGAQGDDRMEGGDGNDVILGLGGNDILRGGNGADWLKGSTGNDILVGGSGSDKLVGNSGRDLLLGGEGRDRLLALRGEDILIGGTTSHDHNDEALSAVLDAWRRDADIDARIAAIENGVDFNGILVDLAKGQSVRDDGAQDLLYGGQHADWYFSSETDRKGDESDEDRRPGEP